MAERKWLAAIGSRDVSQFPPEWLDLYREAVRVAVRWGYGLSTGAAVGCDQTAALTALAAEGSIRLVLPWDGYEEEWCENVAHSHQGQVEVRVYDRSIDTTWTDSVTLYHPMGRSLTRGAFALHARNYGIVEGCQAVIALPNLRNGGGTAQGIRVAKALGIKLFDLSTEEGREQLTRKLARK